MQKTPLPLPMQVATAVSEASSDYYGLLGKRANGPIDVEHLLEVVYGVDIVPTANLEHDHSTDTVLAANFKTIYVDLQQYDNPSYDTRLRFSFAHELAHIKLHKQIFLTDVGAITDQDVRRYHFKEMDTTRYNRLEWQAQEFAGAFLVQRLSLICEAAQLLGNNLDIVYDNMMPVDQLLKAMSPRLAKSFGVSQQVVEIRVEREDLAGYFELDPHSPLNQTSKESLYHKCKAIVQTYGVTTTV